VSDARDQSIAIIGAGPIGLEAALYATFLGHTVCIYDRGEIAENVQQWGFVRMFSPWRMNTTPLGLSALKDKPAGDDCPTGNELRERYLLPLAHLPQLRQCLHPLNNVITIGKDDFTKAEAIAKNDPGESPFRILVTDSIGQERVDHADIIFDCSGTYGHHRWAGRGGIPAPGEMALRNRIWYRIPDVLGRDRERFANRHTLLLGCGFSAATTLHAIQQLQKDFPQTRLSWAIRRPGQAMQAIHGDSLPARRELVLRSLQLADAPPPWLQFLGTCLLEEIKGGEAMTATLRVLKTTLSLQVDEIVALVGYTPDSGISEQLQIHQCYATGGPIALPTALPDGSGSCFSAGPSLSTGLPGNPQPNFFILGAKSYGTNSNFLLQTGHQQIADAFRLIWNDPKLNLYDS
jgi:hypothetical protein